MAHAVFDPMGYPGEFRRVVMSATSSHEITRLLLAWNDGDQMALDKLVPLVEAESGVGMISRDRWERVESIYHAALERDPDTRAAFLDEVCGDDVQLRSEIDSLMKFDGPAAKFIETPAIELEAKAIAAEGESRSAQLLRKEIGPYRLLSIISHGGMGDVFMAVDTRLDRKVAIKLLSTEFTADSERILRFKHEARTTSTLSHPNIVTLYEIGEVDGHPYIVTEYVEGGRRDGRLPVIHQCWPRKR